MVSGFVVVARSRVIVITGSTVIVVVKVRSKALVCQRLVARIETSVGVEDFFTVLIVEVGFSI